MKRLLMFGLLLSLLTFPALGAAAPRSQSEPLQIAASFSILADVVGQVAGENAEVTSLIPLNADPHTFQPTPGDVTALAEADVVFISGAGFEEGLLDVIENADAEMNVVVASNCVEILPFGAAAHDHEGEEHSDEAHEGEEEHADEEHAHEDDEEHAGESDMEAMHTLCDAHHAELEALHTVEHPAVETLGYLFELECGGHAHEEEAEESEGEHAHEEGECDPHVWTVPHNVMLWVMQIRDTLSALDPDNAATYTANADAYLSALNALETDEILPAVEALPEERRVLVTNHETLGYFSAYFGFELVGTVIPGGTTGAEPSAGELGALIELVLEEEVPVIFSENTVGGDLAEVVAEETGASFVQLYSDSLGEDEAATYLDYMRYNVNAMVGALGE